MARKSRGGRGILAVISVVVLVIVVRVGLSIAGNSALDAVKKTYRAPATISGDQQTNDPSLQSILDQAKKEFQLPSLQNAHTEAVAYADASGKPAYILAFGQDNAGRDEVRDNAGLTDQFPGITGVVSQSDSGINVSCGTMSDSGVNFQGCTWYNDNAFGDFIDYVSASPHASSTLLMTTLKSMVS